jgi:hypothetical protein
LHGDAGADADERRQGAFVEGERAFLGPDLGGGVEGVTVLGGGLQPDLDDVEGLAWGCVSWGALDFGMTSFSIQTKRKI